MPLITGATAEALRRGRERYNTKFAVARRTYSKLSGATLGVHLQQTIAPIVEAVAQRGVAADVLDETLEALYDISLEMLGKEFFGATVRYPVMLAGWQQLLRAVPQLLAAEPRRVAGAITNALYNLAVTPNARPAQWLKQLTEIAPACGDDAETFLRAGQVLAWRAGLAHYRAGALAMVETLPENLARAALGLAANAPSVPEALARLQNDEWLDPQRLGAKSSGTQRLQVVASVGAFRGFGGEFLTPPTVTAQDGQIFVSDAENAWLLTADICGATLHRAGSAIIAAPVKASAGDGYGPFVISKLGKVTKDRHAFQFPWLAASTSQAANETTLAVTLPLSHAVFLVALVEI